jgi:hypothetical protein
MSQVGHGLVCLRHHPADQRAARWLLATDDRVGADEFVQMHDFLALMLGLTRPQVTLAAGALKRAGLIDYTRGRVRILDREGPEDVTCECYGVIRSFFDRQLGDGTSSWVPVGG